MRQRHLFDLIGVAVFVVFVFVVVDDDDNDDLHHRYEHLSLTLLTTEDNLMLSVTFSFPF